MRPTLQPLTKLEPSQRRKVRALFTDIDGTLTTEHRLRAETYAALWRWHESGKKLVLVTGRAAGWAEAFARQWPVDAVIAENGNVLFRPGRRGLEMKLSLPPDELARERRRMFAAVRAIQERVPGAKLSGDSRYTEVGLAIDYNEEVHLGAEAAEAIEDYLRRRGFQAVRSSVHVNFWPGKADKLTACRALARAMGLKREELVYVGDSVNDEPMFGGFPLSVGVANVRDVLDRITQPPAYVTRGREGQGFEEVVDVLLGG